MRRNKKWCCGLLAGSLLVGGAWGGGEVQRPEGYVVWPEIPRFENRPYHAQWGFFWFNEQEIWYAQPEWYDQRAQQFADAGITHVMTFSNTHFRWSFRRHFDRINDALAQVVRACHARGIRVVEHHSCNLLFNFADEAGRQAHLANEGKLWPGYAADMALDSRIDGVPLEDLLQYAGSTGKPFYNFYTAFTMCTNNPDYRRSYFKYLEDVYATGVDGIMTDDAQFLSEDSCACRHCRKLFHERTGFELPPGGDGEAWKAFLADRDAPRYLAWRKFRHDSILDFHRAVVAHYRSLNLDLLRPNYSATSITWMAPWGFVFDELPELDWGFQECFGGAVRYSWPEFLFEARHRSMICDRRAIPAMSLWYPRTENLQRLAWAMSLYSNHKYLNGGVGAPGGSELTLESEKGLRIFEKEHFKLLNELMPHAEVALFDSAANRELYSRYNGRGNVLSCGLAHSMLHGNLPFRVVGGPELVAGLEEIKLLIVPDTVFLTDAEIVDLGRFAAAGGTLLWTLGSGMKDPEALERHRSGRVLAELLGLGETELPVPPAVLPHGRGRIAVEEYDRLLAPYSGRCVAWDGSGKRVEFQLPTEADKVRQRQLLERLDEWLPDGSVIRLQSAPEGLLASSYYDPAGTLVMHLVNAAGTLAKPDEELFGENDPAPFAVIENSIEIALRKPAALAAVKYPQASFHRLGAETLTVPVTEAEGWLKLTLPPGILKDYILVEFRRENRPSHLR